MTYLPQIIWLLTWPLLIYVSYKLIVLALKYWDKKQV